MNGGREIYVHVSEGLILLGWQYFQNLSVDST